MLQSRGIQGLQSRGIQVLGARLEQRRGWRIRALRPCKLRSQFQHHAQFQTLQQVSGCAQKGGGGGTREGSDVIDNAAGLGYSQMERNEQAGGQ